jgi:O-phosphoseryl-tRNA(Cys) synthetase
METIDYRQQLLEEIEGLSDRELEKIYKIVILLRHEFLEEDDEARYHTDSWIQAEREATEAYQRGGLKAYDSVDEMMDALQGTNNQTISELEQVLTLINQLGATEKLLIRRHLERDWAEQFAALMDRIQARVPPDISEEEVYADVAEAIREVRADYGDTAGA